MHIAMKPLLVGALFAVATLAGSPALAAAPPTEPAPGEAATVPADWVQLVDDTGTITVSVPPTWTDVLTAPVDLESGATTLAAIEASTDRELFNATFDIAGVTFVAVPFTPDTATAADSFGLGGGCAETESRPYDDGVFVGTRLVSTLCTGNPSAQFHVIAANPVNQAFTAQLRIQIAGPGELPILEGILASFNMTGASAAGTTLPGVATTAPAPATTAAANFPPPTGELPADWVPLVDDTQTIAIAVPSAWTATDTTPMTNDDGTPRPWISATTDQELFIPPQGTADTFSVPGVIYVAGTYESDTIVRLQASSYVDLCTADPVQTYDDGVFVGHIQNLTACGGTSTRIVQVVANPPDQAFTATLLIQLTGGTDDAAILNGLLLSFTTGTAAGASTTTSVG